MANNNTHAAPDVAPRRGCGVRDCLRGLPDWVGPVVLRPGATAGPTRPSGKAPAALKAGGISAPIWSRVHQVPAYGHERATPVVFDQATANGRIRLAE